MQTMNTEHPIIAFTIGMFNAIDGPSHCVYTQAYGLEMQADDEWPFNVLVMAPPHLVSSLTDEADVASLNLIPGASYTPGDGNYKQIVEQGGKWVLARPSDDLAKIAKHGLGVLLLVEDENDIDCLANVDSLAADGLVIALCIDSVSTTGTAKKTAAAIRSKLPSEFSSARVIASGSFEHKNLLDYLSIGGVSGLLLLDASFCAILDLIERLEGEQ